MAPASADLLKEIRDRGVFRVGMAETQPWQAPNPETGTYEGINVELAERAAKIMGVKLEIVPATWATLVPGLEANQFDAVFANLFATPERALVVDFTEPYFTFGFHVVVTANSKIQSLADLDSPELSTFVGQSGTVEESYPKEMFPKAKVRGVLTNGTSPPGSAKSPPARPMPPSLIPAPIACSRPRIRPSNSACAFSMVRMRSSSRSVLPMRSAPASRISSTS